MICWSMFSQFTYSFFLSWQREAFVVESDTDWVSLKPVTTEPLEHKGMLMLEAGKIRQKKKKMIKDLTILYESK